MRDTAWWKREWEEAVDRNDALRAALGDAKAEAERLRYELAMETAYLKEAHEDTDALYERLDAAVAEAAALRDALAALYDSVQVTPFWLVGFDEFDAARSAAGRVLGRESTT